MEIIKTYAAPTNLRVYTLDASDAEAFAKLGIKPETITRLQKYLSDKDSKVKVVETYDPASGWRGFEFWLDETDLSLNGYCFSEKRLDYHLSINSY
jgi:hypothetical protein